MSPRRNVVRITVDFIEGSTTRSKTYTIEFLRGSAQAFLRQYVHEIDGLSAHGNDDPRGIWSDGTTLWVVEDNEADDDRGSKIYAYELSGGARQSDRDITLPMGDEARLRGLWANETQVWVIDAKSDIARAFDLTTAQAASSADIPLRPDPRFDSFPSGIWADSEMIWVVENKTEYILARNASDNSRNLDRDIRKIVGGENLSAYSLWGNGATLWVLGTNSGPLGIGIFAFDLVTGERREDLDFADLYDFGVRAPGGIWSDGTTMYVSDRTSDKVFAFNMPLNTDLSTLAVTSGSSTVVDIGVFSAGTDAYDAEVANSVTLVTVEATVASDDAIVSFSVEDADDTAEGHQVALSEGLNKFTITVTNGDSIRIYLVRITRLGS